MVKRRFIAGAVCPECQQLDKVVMYDDSDNQRWRECVSCGFKELLEDMPVDEVSTRVNQLKVGEKPLAHETAIDAIRIVDAKKP